MKLILATGNAHKVREMQALAAAFPIGMEVVSAAVVPAWRPPAEGLGTFAGNAAIKARSLRVLAPAEDWVLADDSGLCVDALGGAPGVLSARYAGPRATDRQNLEKLLEALKEVPDEERTARFSCSLCLIGPGGEPKWFEGHCGGVLLREPVGGGGFGYDPIFVPAGQTRTMAELDGATKNRISHRGRAWRRMGELLREMGGGTTDYTDGAGG